MNKKHKILLIVISAFLLLFPSLYFSQFLNGLFLNIVASENTSATTIFVDPSNSTASIGENFTVYVNVSNVVDLYGWEFKLSWNNTIINVVNVIEGSFLKSGGETFFTYKINDTGGYIITDCTLLGDVSGVNGNGTLASVEFHVKTYGNCTLDLYDTTLVSSFEQPIEHTAIDGYYYTSTVIHDVAVIKLTASIYNINVTVENQGTSTETFDVSVYYTHLTDPLIGTQTVTLEPGANTTLTFSWSPADGEYEIQAEANTVPGEEDTADNTLTISFYAAVGGGGFGNFRPPLLK